MTPQEMTSAPSLPRNAAWMACRFSPDSTGLSHIPDALPPGAMLILNDRFPCRSHDPVRIAEEMAAAVERLNCGSVLLDFERKPSKETEAIANALLEALSCPLAAPPGFAADSDCGIFLPPCPLRIPLAEYLHPWQGRDIWLDVTAQQQTITVTRKGMTCSVPAPPDRQGGILDELLLCRYITEVSEAEVRFTLFDTPETLKMKLEHAAELGVSRAVGLYQELGCKL